MMVTVYVAGPISGRANGNREAFEHARLAIEENPNARAIIPHDLYSPGPVARICPAFQWCQAMLLCLPAVEAADFVYLLDGWQSSRGASRERMVAKEKGKKCLYEEAR